MRDTKGKHISEWKPVSELRPVGKDISYLGYTKEYIQINRLKETKRYHCASSTGVINFFEPIEVKSEKGIVYYRENDNHVHRDVPDYFDTQFGRFNNHNNGEFLSWLGKAVLTGLLRRNKKTTALLTVTPIIFRAISAICLTVEIVAMLFLISCIC